MTFKDINEKIRSSNLPSKVQYRLTALSRFIYHGKVSKTSGFLLYIVASEVPSLIDEFIEILSDILVFGGLVDRNGFILIDIGKLLEDAGENFEWGLQQLFVDNVGSVLAFTNYMSLIESKEYSNFGYFLNKIFMHMGSCGVVFTGNKKEIRALLDVDAAFKARITTNNIYELNPEN